MINRVPSSLSTSCLCISLYNRLIQLSIYRFRISRGTPCVRISLGMCFIRMVSSSSPCAYIFQYNVFVRLAIYRVNTPLSIPCLCTSHYTCIVFLHLQYTALVHLSIYRGADKSLARPGRKQSRMHVRDARDFNKIETRDVIKFFPSLQG